MMSTHKALQALLDKLTDHKKVFGTSFCLKYKGETWTGASGNLDPGSLFFIASTTKLFVTSLILNFQSKGLVHLDDKIADYLDAETMKDLHHAGGKDHAGMITLKHLLAHTSGIPDYFQQKNSRGESLEREITAGKDRAWTFEQAVAYSKTLKPLFAPGAKGRAHYSDTNFQLLGQILGQISGRSFSGLIQEEICQPLGLVNTYLYTDPTDERPKTFYFKERELHIPKAMSSFGPDGGIVSTSGELLIFLQAFFKGELFPAADIESLKTWNRIFFPMHAGIGLHRFRLPLLFDPMRKIPELIGHSGLSGTLAYYSPEKDLYITGTVNQVAYPDTSFRLAIQLIRKALSA
jgi:D-alanyl-D-alanine carboxypeptidase